MLVSGDANRCRKQLGHILKGYEDFCEFDDRELHLFEAPAHRCACCTTRPGSRGAGTTRHSRRVPWFGTVRYWQDRVLELREQVAAMQEPAPTGVFTL
jgi:Ser/Thr protein kinase RdoA (MazF antagonist)